MARSCNGAVALVVLVLPLAEAAAWVLMAHCCNGAGVLVRSGALAEASAWVLMGYCCNGTGVLVRVVTKTPVDLHRW